MRGKRTRETAGFMFIKRQLRQKRHLAWLAAAVVAALTAAACSSSGAPPGSGSGGKPVKGGTATIALPANVTYNWIFPFYPITNASVYNAQQFQWLMVRPLYMFGNNSNTSVLINYPLSPANQPVYSNGGKTVTVTMKGWKWSNGEPVDAKSVIFYLNMAEGEKANWYAYSKGLLPDNIVSYKATSPNTVTFQLDRAYSSLWFTYNQLAELTPMPMSWDVTKLGATPGSGGCITDTAADNWAKCKAVFQFLTAQSKQAGSYASSPLWSVVNGPWKLSSFSTDGNVTMVPNKSYSGPVKPKLAALKFVPFTSDSAEYTALKTGQVDVGYIPTQDLPQKPASAALPATNPLGSGYNLQPFFNYGIQFAQPNFNNPQVGFMVRQLYIRQAVQAVIDQPAISKAIWRGYATPTSGPGTDHGDEPVRAAHPEGQRRAGPVPVQHLQGQVAADQPRLVRVWRGHDLPGPGEVRHWHQEGPAAEVHVRLLDGRGRGDRDLAGHQVRCLEGRHRHQPGRPVVQHDHRRECSVRADGPQVQHPGVRLRRLGLRRARLRADRRAAVRVRCRVQLG